MDLVDFDMNLLLTFDAIYRHQNLSAAAIELGLTQPAVSAALKRLRERFDNPLFVRTSHGMRPTPYADSMSVKITRALDIVREVDQPDDFSPQTTTVNFRVYINDIGMLLMMPQVMTYLGEHAPGARLSIFDFRPDEVIPALDSGVIDLAIGYFPGMPNWAHQQVVRNTSYVCAVRGDHPFIKNSLSLDQFVNAKHGMYWTSGSPHSAVEEALSRLDLTRDVMLRLPRFSALPFFISQSDLIMTIPEDLGVGFSRMINIKLFKPPLKLPNFEIRQYWHERHHADPANKWLRNIIKRETADMLLLRK
ncbi:MAG: LysR family transcriptional regulator [Polaromonas sp.]|uniref:LysR family transcriptional regulator n=1 Tax=Polaromonas sp. TaxID=1869339 RepID=UPI0025CE9321|nr:LysR family transcriptional regulator [Polaromonas sp.]MBI2729054.1 LysR family transcriptional regulator [Polaromonas sp.]